MLLSAGDQTVTLGAHVLAVRGVAVGMTAAHPGAAFLPDAVERNVKKAFAVCMLLLAATAADRRNTAALAASARSYGAVAPVFAENVELTDAAARFVSLGGGRAVFFTERDVRLTEPRLRRSLWLTFSGGAPSRVHGEHPSGTMVTRLRPGGSSSTRAFHDVVYRNVWPGVDARFTGRAEGLEYSFEIAPHADPSTIRLEYRGADRLRVNSVGDLVIETPDGETIDRAPTAFQTINGHRIAVSARYLLDGDTVMFAVGDYDRSRPLVIDPTIVYSTFLGGSGSDSANGIAVDGAGAAYVAGTTGSLDFPTTPGAYQPSFRGGTGNLASDAFVAKLNPGGTQFEYVTFLGGSGNDGATSVAIDASGNALVAGFTESGDFPTANAFRPAIGSPHDGFVAKLNAAGSDLVYSTFLGGNDRTDASQVAVDAAGNAYVTGYTTADNLPVTAGAVASASGGRDGFLLKFNPAGTSLLYGTYIGGGGDDYALDVAVDGDGRAHVTGTANSDDFPTTAGAAQPIPNSAIFKSTSNGDGFEPVNSGVRSRDVRSLAIDPQEPSIVYAATADRGVLKSTDGGATWAQSNSGIGSGISATDIAINPNTPQTLIASAVTSATSGLPHLFRSTDGGDSWIDVMANASRPAITPSEPSIVYAAHASAVIRSTDGGTTWTAVLAATPSAIAIDPTNADNVYVGTTTGEIFRTKDRGATWNRFFVGSQGFTPTIASLAVDPTSPETIWAGLLNSGLVRSTNGGASFAYVQNASVDSPVALRFDGSTLYVASSALVITFDSGATFQTRAIRGNYPGIRALAVKDGTVFVGGKANADAFVWKVDTNAASSALQYGTYLGGSAGDGGRAVALDPEGKAVVVLSTGSADISTTNGSLHGIRYHLLARLSSDGSGIEASGYFGPRGSYVIVNGIAVDGAGFSYVTGVYDDDDPRVWIERVDSSATSTTQYFVNAPSSTFQGWDAGNAVAVDPSGSVYVAGTTMADGHPVTAGAPQTTNAGKGDAFVMKLSFDDAASMADLARGKPTFALSTYGSEYVAGNATDGDPSTRWSSEFSDPQWIYVDLGERIQLDHLVLRWETAYGSDYVIEVSEDATNWMQVLRSGSYGGTESVGGFRPSAAGRYVRLQGLHRGTEWGYSLWSFEVYGTPTGAPPPANVALNKPASASSVEDESYAPSSAVDGDPNTRWSSQFSDPQWFMVDLGQSYHLSRVLLRWETAFGADYTIEVSDDGSTWRTIAGIGYSDGDVDDLTWISGSGRYVRLTGTRRGTEWGYSLWEFEVYGTPVGPSPP